MLTQMIDNLSDLMTRGGKVMWPLLGLSIIGMTLILERAWFWMTTNFPSRTAKFARVARHLREGDHGSARALIEDDHSVYGNLVRQMLDENASEAVITEAVDNQRPRMDRFMPTLGTIITAAPMLGILGTVTGIISAFKVLSDALVTDPSKIGAGIAEALLTTVAGLVIALVVLFPYNAYRAQIDRTLSRMEALIAAARREKKGTEGQRDEGTK